MSGSISLESSSITLRTANGLNSTPPNNVSQQSQLNRLQNSTSTNSLFGPPHHLGTFNGSNHNVTNSNSNSNSTPTSPSSNNVSAPSTATLQMHPSHDSPDHRLKRESFTTDDSAPDITQLVLSAQRFPLTVNSVDNILRTLSHPRKHTNSTSSTGSSLSEAWSVTKLNSQDSHQTTRTVSLLLILVYDHK